MTPQMIMAAAFADEIEKISADLGLSAALPGRPLASSNVSMATAPTRPKGYTGLIQTPAKPGGVHGQGWTWSSPSPKFPVSRTHPAGAALGRRVAAQSAAKKSK